MIKLNYDSIKLHPLKNTTTLMKRFVNAVNKEKFIDSFSVDLSFFIFKQFILTQSYMKGFGLKHDN